MRGDAIGEEWLWATRWLCPSSVSDSARCHVPKFENVIVRCLITQASLNHG